MTPTIPQLDLGPQLEALAEEAGDGHGARHRFPAIHPGSPKLEALRIRVRRVCGAGTPSAWASGYPRAGAGAARARIGAGDEVITARQHVHRDRGGDHRGRRQAGVRRRRDGDRRRLMTPSRSRASRRAPARSCPSISTAAARHGPAAASAGAWAARDRGRGAGARRRLTVGVAGCARGRRLLQLLPDEEPRCLRRRRRRHHQ